VVLVSGVVGICTAFYFMRSRRKGKIFITKNVAPKNNKNKYDSTAASTTSSSSMYSEDDESKANLDQSSNNNENSSGSSTREREGATSRIKGQSLTPGHGESETDNSEEKLDIGFGSDPCWTDQKTRDSKMKAERNDILHNGSRKGGKLVVVLVGLPGSGKTYIARKVSRYLRWISYRTRVFSLAKYRLEKVGSKQASFFDPDDQVNYQMRVKLMMLAVSEAMQYLNRDGEIAIIDGTNYCRSRRDLIRETVSREEGFEILWIESIISSGE
jgi:predicted kinase